MHEGQSLETLRQRLRRTLRWLGVSELLVVVVLAIVISFSLDYLLELPWIFRGLILAGFIVLYVRTTARAKKRLRYAFPSSDLLQTAESHYPSLDGQLLTATEFRNELKSPGETSALREYLLQRATQEAVRASHQVHIEKSLNLTPLLQRSFVAVGGILLLLFLTSYSPGNFGIWAQRNLLLSTVGWPRRTHFAFDREELVWRHARKDPLEITAWVLGEVPRTVTIHIHAQSEDRTSRLVPGARRLGTWKLASLEKNGFDAADSDVEGRALSYTFPRVVEDFEFYLSGGDNRSETVRVEVRDRPRIEASRFTLSYPPHAGLAEKVIENAAAEVTALVGTQITFEADVSESLDDAWVRFGATGHRESVHRVNEQTFQYTFELKKSDFLEVGLTAGEWKLEAQPLRFALVAYPDRYPEVALKVEGKNRLITPKATLSYGVVARDDYGLSRLELKIQKEGGAAGGHQPDGGGPSNDGGDVTSETD